MLIRKFCNGQLIEYINKREFFTFTNEYFDIVDPTELWLDIVEYGSTCDLFWNGRVFRFESTK